MRSDQPSAVSVLEAIQARRISVDHERVGEYVKGRAVLVTGAGGTVGRALAERMVQYHPERLILLENDENRLKDAIEVLELQGIEASPVLVDLRDKRSLERVFAKHRPALIYHSAAYKFVTMTEANPEEAFRVNVMGTLHLLQLAQEAERFVYFSSGKAVDPFHSSVLGLTKQLAEFAVLAHAQSNQATRFSIVRFTHVIEGSLVINRFSKQIAAGQPVTVVHQDMNSADQPPPGSSKIGSMFQNVTEAADLALLAGLHGAKGEVFALTDYGRAVQIEDIAKDLICKAKSSVGIRYIAPRPGDSPRLGSTGQRLTINPMFNDRENRSAIVLEDVVRADPAQLDGQAVLHSIYELSTAIDSGLSSAQVKARLDAVVWDYLQGRMPPRDPRWEIRERRTNLSFGASYLRNQCVMITGSGGLVGEALLAYLIEHGAKKLLLADFNENALKDAAVRIRLSLQKKGLSHVDVITTLLDLQHKREVEKVFRNHSPQIVFHAAAYKLQPIIEESPTAAVINNLSATLNLVGAARTTPGVELFIFVSTDKAAHPTAIYDRTKRIGELIVESGFSGGSIRYGSVRFGNVLEKSPVIDLFYEQARQGLPLTVTHPEASRYFMRLDEAIRLILLAGARAERGEIFVVDMGKPLSILEVAKAIIREFGKEPKEDETFRIAGLSPHEKLHEKLFAHDEEARKIRREDGVFVLSPERCRTSYSMLDLQIRGLISRLKEEELRPEELNFLLRAILGLEHDGLRQPLEET